MEVVGGAGAGEVNMAGGCVTGQWVFQTGAGSVRLLQTGREFVCLLL